ncbi:TonB-dependent receptor domain-containing protein [Rufibacter quisquiliarum]|uniref:Outer membrane receptor protein involved in Fe transport n=1 Tax=Rufibacter quisquiliarum TaxID=1549639 RepID=A0A839GUN6_9BACT|nr:TonB-dependent receptor [Rufibacter quisquiliarum]MBA9078597.1 outer membrane receptor protein involved in Fe transport [Rufibacter quisquiliarum]
MMRIPLQHLACLALFFLVLLLPATASASSAALVESRQTGGVTLTGTVADAVTRKPVDFATVALQDKAGKPLNGATCDDKGAFTMPRVAPGDYVLAVSFVGYKTRLHPITVSAGASSQNVGSILLETDSKALEEVVVTAEKDLIQETDDGLVYNAENDITNIGGTAADVLKKVPSLAVDIDGNVEMRGSPKIKILINGKPSSMLGDNLAEALAQIPADMIKSVEVISSPSAKYDAEGTAGVVNIITKKSSVEGMTGSVTGTLGNRTNNLNSNLNIRKKKVGIRATVGGNFNDRNGDSESEQQYFREENTIQTPTKQIQQVSTFDNNGRSIFAQLGGDYEFNEHTSLSASMRLNAGRNLSDRTLTTNEFTPAGEERVNNFRFRDMENTGRSSGLDMNLHYKRKFKKKGQELDVLTILNNNQSGSDYQLAENNRTGTITRREESDNQGRNREITFQADYSHPFDKWGSLDIGSRAVLRNSSSDYSFSFARTANAPLQLDPVRSNRFNYDQDVYSTYLSYTYRFKKTYTFRLGGRYEYTNVQGQFNTNNIDTNLDKPFHNFMPNVMVMRNFAKGQRLRLSYSTRIQRPGIGQLNPYRNESNQLNIRYGNPNLDAELTHNTEVNYSWLIKNTSVNTSAYWRQTNNDIAHYQFPVSPSSDTLNTTFENLGKNAVYGTSVSASTRIKKNGQAGLNLNLYYNNLYSFVGKYAVSRAGWMYNLSGNLSYRFEKDFSVQTAASYNSPRISLQSRSTANYSYSLGLRKEFLKRKAGVSLNVENFISSLNTIRTTVNNTNSNNLNFNNNYNRIVRLSFNYRFGKMEFKRDKALERLTGQGSKKKS